MLPIAAVQPKRFNRSTCSFKFTLLSSQDLFLGSLPSVLNGLTWFQIESGDSLTSWFEHRRPDFADIVNICQNLLVDETSAITIRLTLTSIKIFIRPLLESNQGRIALSLLDDLSSLVSAKYWLVKIELCSIIADIPFLAVYHLTGKSNVQVRQIFKKLSISYYIFIMHYV